MITNPTTATMKPTAAEPCVSIKPISRAGSPSSTRAGAVSASSTLTRNGDGRAASVGRHREQPVNEGSERSIRRVRLPPTVPGSDARRGGGSTARAWRAGAGSRRPGRWDRPPSSRRPRRREQPDAQRCRPDRPDRRREAVNMPVAAVRAPDGDQHRGEFAGVRETVEHHRGVGGSYWHIEIAFRGRGSPRCLAGVRPRPRRPSPDQRRPVTIRKGGEIGGCVGCGAVNFSSVQPATPTPPNMRRYSGA